MKFDIAAATEILQRTPKVLRSLLAGLNDEWIMSNEGHETFSPYDVLGHLIYGERTDWVPRAKIILSNAKDKAFKPWDRFAQYEESKGKTLGQLLTAFEEIRRANVEWLLAAKISTNDLEKTGIHPNLGVVTLQNLLSTWVVHDLTHIAQITRVMAKQYKEEIGPWMDFFRILNF